MNVLGLDQFTPGRCRPVVQRMASCEEERAAVAAVQSCLVKGCAEAPLLVHRWPWPERRPAWSMVRHTGVDLIGEESDRS